MSDAAAVVAGADLRAVLRDALESGKAIEIVELPTGEQSGGMFDWMLIATATSSVTLSPSPSGCGGRKKKPDWARRKSKASARASGFCSIPARSSRTL